MRCLQSGERGRSQAPGFRGSHPNFTSAATRAGVSHSSPADATDHLIAFQRKNSPSRLVEGLLVVFARVGLSRRLLRVQTFLGRILSGVCRFRAWSPLRSSHGYSKGGVDSTVAHGSAGSPFGVGNDPDARSGLFLEEGEIFEQVPIGVTEVHGRGRHPPQNAWLGCLPFGKG